MASLSQRVIRDDIDISAAVNSYAYENAATMDLPTSGDYLYIGSEVPFNNLWFQLHTANNTTTQVAIDTWWGQQWTPCVDIVDETAVSGVSLAKHGRIQWSLDDLKGWDCEDRSADVPGLENTKIYNMYWARFSWNNGVPPSGFYSYIGQKFSGDQELFIYWKDLDRPQLLQTFDQTDWTEQSILAAEAIIRDLKAAGKIIHRGQIFDHTVFTEASCHKTAELVYAGLGQAFESSRVICHEYYRQAMKTGLNRLDNDKSGRLTQKEKATHTVFTKR